MVEMTIVNLLIYVFSQYRCLSLIINLLIFQYMCLALRIFISLIPSDDTFNDVLYSFSMMDAKLQMYQLLCLRFKLGIECLDFD
jgi:hypothetical protein